MRENRVTTGKASAASKPKTPWRQPGKLHLKGGEHHRRQGVYPSAAPAYQPPGVEQCGLRYDGRASRVDEFYRTEAGSMQPAMLSGFHPWHRHRWRDASRCATAASAQAFRAFAVRHLLGARNLDGRQDRGGADGRGRVYEVGGRGIARLRGARSSATPPGCQLIFHSRIGPPRVYIIGDGASELFKSARRSGL